MMVLHELNLAARFADQLVCMKNGQITYNGCVENVFNEAMLKSVFNLDCLVMNDPINNCPLCIAK